MSLSFLIKRVSASSRLAGGNASYARHTSSSATCYLWWCFSFIVALFSIRRWAE
jgi:hypothetical protein